MMPPALDAAPQRRLHKLLPVLMHVVIWGGLLCIPLLPDLWHNETVDLPLGTERLLKFAIVGLVVAMFYAGYAFLAPRFFFRKRHGAFILGALGVCLGGVGVIA